MRNFEFPDPATIEWHDGTDYDGGAEIVAVTLKRARILMSLDEGIDIDVTYRIDEKQFAKLTSYLTRIFDGLIRFEA